MKIFFFKIYKIFLDIYKYREKKLTTLMSNVIAQKLYFLSYIYFYINPTIINIDKDITPIPRVSKTL